MKRINVLLNDPDYLKYLDKNEKAEVDRIYCHHDIVHLLDVCRIAYILSLEEQLLIDKEMIYAAGLLHDIGRWKEYEEGNDHAAASKDLAQEILRKVNFSEMEKQDILTAIEWHRKKDSPSDLADILYRADKESRNCTFCKGKETCKKFQNGEETYLRY